MTLKDKIRSLTRNEVKVLYQRCKEDKNIVIAAHFDRSKKWVETQITSINKKLAVPQGLTTAEAREFFAKKKVCETLRKLIKAPADLDRWPLYGFFGKEKPQTLGYDWRKEIKTLTLDELDARIAALADRRTELLKEWLGSEASLKEWEARLENFGDDPEMRAHLEGAMEAEQQVKVAREAYLRSLQEDEEEGDDLDEDD